MKALRVRELAKWGRLVGSFGVIAIVMIADACFVLARIGINLAIVAS